MNEHFIQQKLYCYKCGSKLVFKEVIAGYNEYDGIPITIMSRGCPSCDFAGRRTVDPKRTYGEDLDD